MSGSKIAYRDDWTTLYTGTALGVLKEMPPQSVHCAITSPPYWGLRSYLPSEHPDKGQELGTEKTPDEYVAKLVEVFGELWRVLRDDGTLWVNIGDSYAAGKAGRTDHGSGDPTSRLGPLKTGLPNGTPPGLVVPRKAPPGLKPKDLCMVPARLAIALQADGWYLRSAITWAKPNPMPESTKDRPTQATEMIYMLTKKPRYFFDAEAVREPSAPYRVKQPDGWDTGEGGHGSFHRNSREKGASTGQVRSGRNLRNWWQIATQPYPGAHFATFPMEIPLRCIKAGTSEKGVCSECGAPWRRVVETSNEARTLNQGRNGFRPDEIKAQAAKGASSGGYPESRTVGWEPTCTCGGPDDLAPGDSEIVATPTGTRIGDDPSKITGRAGMNRPRGEDEGQRPITRYEQRRYALQLRESPHRDAMAVEAGSAFAHYIRTDRSGARPVPQHLLDTWILRGWLRPVAPPEINPPDVIPATVLDPFMGSGTTAQAAASIGRRSIGIDLDGRSAKMLAARMMQPWAANNEEEMDITMAAQEEGRLF